MFSQEELELIQVALFNTAADSREVGYEDQANTFSKLGLKVKAMQAEYNATCRTCLAALPKD